MRSDVSGKYLGLKSTALKVERKEELSVAFKVLLFPNVGRRGGLIAAGWQEYPKRTLDLGCLLGMGLKNCHLRNSPESYSNISFNLSPRPGHF